MRILTYLLTGLLVAVQGAGAQDALVEHSGYLLDLNRSRDTIVLGTKPGNPSGLRLKTSAATVIYEEQPAALTNIVRGTTLAVSGKIYGNRIEVTRLVALAVTPEEGRYNNKVVGRMERQDGQHSLLVNNGIYLLRVGRQTEVLRHEKADLGRLQYGQKLTVTVQETKETPWLARQIIFQPTAEEKLEKERILL